MKHQTIFLQTCTNRPAATRTSCSVRRKSRIFHNTHNWYVTLCSRSDAVSPYSFKAAAEKYKPGAGGGQGGLGADALGLGHGHGMGSGGMGAPSGQHPPTIDEEDSEGEEGAFRFFSSI